MVRAATASVAQELIQIEYLAGRDEIRLGKIRTAAYLSSPLDKVAGRLFDLAHLLRHNQAPHALGRLAPLDSRYAMLDEISEEGREVGFSREGNIQRCRGEA